MWSPAGLSSGTLVLPDLCQRHGESEQGSGLCPADDTNIVAIWEGKWGALGARQMV